MEFIKELLKLLSAMTGDYRYNKILANREEVKNMCDVAQRLGITVEKLKANMVNTGFKYPDNEE